MWDSGVPAPHIPVDPALLTGGAVHLQQVFQHLVQNWSVIFHWISENTMFTANSILT